MRVHFPARPASIVVVRGAALAVAAMVALASGATPAVHAQAGARERTLFVSALDARGEPVEGLGPTDFVVTEDGRRREVLRVSRAIEPIDIAVLADTSAAASRLVPPMRDGLRTFIAALAGEHQIAIVGLADRPTILVDYTSNRMRLEQGVGRLFSMDASGMTLLDAIVEVTAGLRRREAPRAVIVPIISTGVEFTNRNGRDVTKTVTDAGVAIHAIVVGVLDFQTNEERERAYVLDTGSRDSGGQHVTLLTESAVEGALAKLARQLSAQYKVVYGRPESLIPPEKTEIASGRAGVTMRGTPARGQGGA
jgi:VWFA-related protein